MTMSGSASKLERWFVLAVAAHSFAVGLALLVAPPAFFRWAGWDAVAIDFFARQGGAFHLVVAAGYLIEHLRHRGITLIVTAKSIATVFLLARTLGGEPAWIVPVSAVADAAMALLVVALHRRASREQADRCRHLPTDL